jgi:hypothetical protein
MQCDEHAKYVAEGARCDARKVYVEVGKRRWLDTV